MAAPLFAGTVEKTEKSGIGGTHARFRPPLGGLSFDVKPNRKKESQIKKFSEIENTL